MPKFYITDGTENTIIVADNALQACFRSIQYRFAGIPVDGFYKVSEQGFENHDDDTIFSSDEVIVAFMELMEKTKQNKKDRKDRRDRKKSEDED